MILTQVLLRSFRSFNYDYRRKSAIEEGSFPKSKALWEPENDYESWRPWIQVSIESPITCMVGSNESGKTFLIDAIWKAWAGERFALEDICRYSPECHLDSLSYPRVGLVWAGNPTELQAAVQSASGSSIDAPEDGTRLVILHDQGGAGRLILLKQDGTVFHEAQLEAGAYEGLHSVLPTAFQVKSDLSVPSSVPLTSLFKLSLVNATAEDVQQFLSEFGDVFADKNVFDTLVPTKEEVLVYRLLVASLKLDLSMLKHIARASEPLLKQFSYQASELTEELLNLSYWWGQDVDLRLNIDLRNDKIILNVTDRTEAWYGFSERSQGMKFFLGYLVQILLQLRIASRPLLILSDEPDFALSAVGQRDLLKFYERIVSGDGDYPPCQLLYTTHSAELIDPNYPGRITVLQKGRFDEGTRVISRAHHRLFEPVRTALGGRVCSLPFIDGPNLVVEGSSDRAFVMRMSQYLAARKQPHLNLAYLSIVDAQGKSNIARVVVAAKHVDGDRAYITILLDNDEPGRAAATEARALDDSLGHRKQIVSIEDVLGPGLGKDTEIEDLVPCSVYLKALTGVLKDRGHEDVCPQLPSAIDLEQAAQSQPIVDILEPIVKNHSSSPTLVQLPKEDVIERVFDLLESEEIEETDRQKFESCLAALSGILLNCINDNLRHKRHEEIQRKLRYMIREFFSSYRKEVSKARAQEFLGELRSLGMTIAPVGGFDREVDLLVQQYHFTEGLSSEVVEDYARFRQDIVQLPQKLTIDPHRSML